MATVKDQSGNTPSMPKGSKPRIVDPHIKSKLEIIADNTEPA